MKTVWVVGRVGLWKSWELMGVYTTFDQAEKACKVPRDFIGPVPLDEALPDEPTEWPGAYYPDTGKELIPHG